MNVPSGKPHGLRDNWASSGTSTYDPSPKMQEKERELKRMGQKEGRILKKWFRKRGELKRMGQKEELQRMRSINGELKRIYHTKEKKEKMKKKKKLSQDKYRKK